jgi:hypothetical protein
MKQLISYFVLSTLLFAVFSNVWGQADKNKLVTFQTINKAQITVFLLDNEKGLQFVYQPSSGKTIVFPSQLPQNNNWEQFTYGGYFRPGGVENDGLDLNNLSFQFNDRIYVIYENYIAVGDVRELGMKILNLKEEKIAEYKGLFKSLKGSLIDLRYIEAIPKSTNTFE